MGIQAELVPCAGGELNNEEPALEGMRKGRDAGNVQLRGDVLVPLLSPCPSAAAPAAVCTPSCLSRVGYPAFS